MDLLNRARLRHRFALAAALSFVTTLDGAVAAPQFDKIVAEARSAREQNKFDDALTLYRQALALKPDWNEGLWYASTILYDQERYLDAATGLKRFLAHHPKSGSATALLGLSEFQLKDYRAAATHLDQARALGVENGPLASAALFHYALLLTRFGQYEVSGQMLLAFAQRGQITPAVIEASGLAGLRKPLLPSEVPFEDADMVSAAGRAMCAAVEHHDQEATQEFARLVANYPDKPNVHYLRGSFLLTGDASAAFGEFENELKLNPNHVPALVAVSMEYLNRGEPAKALPFAERAVKTDPQAVAAHAVLGKVLTETGGFDRAIQELQTAVKLAPDSPQVRIALASAYAKAGRSKEAAQERAEFLRLRKASEGVEAK
jgi:tetratricopeptide (TPR) repeat protein